MKYAYFEPDKEDWLKLMGVQSGGAEIAYYQGRKYQRGGSLGSIISTIWRSIPKFLNSTVGKAVIGGLSGIASDVKEGVPLREAAKKHGRSQVRNLTGLGKKKKRKTLERKFYV